MNNWKSNAPTWPGWETVGLIGSGSFGSVYEIQRDVFGHTESAALKVITIPQNESEIDDLLDDGYDAGSITTRYHDDMQAIVREYSLMSEMKGCTNIVNCEDVKYIQHADGIGWDILIKMELLKPLRKAFGAAISEADVIRIGKDLCNALVSCEAKNILHRDIKPQNIFVSEDGTCKLGDFGIAKKSQQSISQSKSGTVEYMAPEVYNNQPYGHRSDIYSLGLVLYWLLNKRRGPFLPLPPNVPTATDVDEAQYRRFHGEALPEPADGSPALKQIVLKACAFSPADRYASAKEMLSALNALDGAESSQTPPEPPEKPKTPKTPGHRTTDESKLPPHLLIALVAGAIVLILVAALALKGCDKGDSSGGGAAQTSSAQASVSTPTSTVSSTPTPQYIWSEWSDWSTNLAVASDTREVETRQNYVVVGYNMVHYGTRRATNPNYRFRMFRDYSISGNLEAYEADTTYGEKHLTRYVSAALMSTATSYPPNGDLVVLTYNDEMYSGFQMGNTTAYNFGDDNKVWFIESEDYANVTEYRHRDLIKVQ